MSLMATQPRIDVDAPVSATASFDPPSVQPGDNAIYRVTFNALEESIEWPDKLPLPPKLAGRPGAHGQVYGMSGTGLQPRTSFLYHVHCAEGGQFAVPEFTVMVYGKPVQVPTAQLEVTNSPTPAMPAQRLLLDIAATNLYVGQPVHVSIVCPATGGLVFQGGNPVQVIGSGFIIEQSNLRSRYEVRPTSPGAPPVVLATYETTLTPIASGTLSAFAQGFAASRGAGVIIISGPGQPAMPSGLPQYTLLDSDPIELHVRPLPREGQLPGFTGAVGAFAGGEPELATNVLRVGDPVKLSVKVRGDANCNLSRLVAPPAPRLGDWQILRPTADNAAPQVIQAQGFITLSYTLIPLSEEVRSTPAIPFCCFDPRTAAYTDLTIKPVSVTVLPGASPADLQALQQANSDTGPAEKEPVLSGLALRPGFAPGSLVPLQRRAWFPFLQLIPAAAFLALWTWDRRRRYLELHPEVLLRRRARRALRRERRALHRAARSGDAPRFASAAINALRVVCAPHYPAEPCALVGSDVLAVLPDPDRSGPAGEVVRRFFLHADAARFAIEPVEITGLLRLQPELESVLTKLEASLG
jgi:hypothetical protein